MVDMEKLILCIEKNPCIWDHTHEDYRDRLKKDKVWLEIGSNLIRNWDKLSAGERKIKGIELKRKWSNCRDYYKKNLEAPNGKKRRYIFANILGFLDKIFPRKIREDNYEVVYTEALSVDTEDAEDPEDAEDAEDADDVDDTDDELEDKDVKIQKDIKVEITADNEEPKPKRKKTQNTPPIYDDGDDEKFLLSFSSDMKRMTHQQKINFKLGVTVLLKNVFTEN